MDSNTTDSIHDSVAQYVEARSNVPLNVSMQQSASSVPVAHMQQPTFSLQSTHVQPTTSLQSTASLQSTHTQQSTASLQSTHTQLPTKRPPPNDDENDDEFWKRVCYIPHHSHIEER